MRSSASIRRDEPSELPLLARPPFSSPPPRTCPIASISSKNRTVHRLSVREASREALIGLRVGMVYDFV